MTVYQVTMPYFDGDHDHGSYTSPTFAKREDAERFAQAIRDLPDHDPRKWLTDDFGCGDGCNPYVEEVPVIDSWDGELPTARESLSMTFS